MSEPGSPQGGERVGATRGARGDGGPEVTPVPLGMPAFDEHRPPRQELVADCVHCGFCLPACPTYTLWGEEMDSPRGRIYLMDQGLSGEPMTDSMVRHFDACLGCMACVPACPSGVQYDRLIEATRAQVERRYQRPAKDRLLREAIFAVFPYPRRLRLLRGPLAAYQRTGLLELVRRSGLLARLAPTLAVMQDIAPPVGRARPLPERVTARAHPAGDGRHAHRLRTGRLLPGGERRHRPGAGAGGLRRRHPPPAGLLRRAERPQRTRG